MAVIAACVLLVFSPLVGMGTLLITPEGPTQWSDMLNASYPFRLLSAQGLARGHLPLWTDQIFCGYPLLANPAVGTFYPLNWLFVIVPGPAAMSLMILLTCMMAGWFTYYYCRTLGLGRAPATLAGMSFAVCGFFAGHAKHVALSGSACWLPLQLSLIEQAVRDRGRAGVRAALWLAPVTALQALAGGLQFVYISALAMALYALIRLASRARTELRWRLARYALLWAVMAGGLALTAQQLLPARELSSVSERAAGLASKDADPFPMPPADLLTLVSADAVGRPTDDSYYKRNPKAGIFWEDYIYAGWPVVALAAIGLPWALWRRPPARVLLVLWGAGILLALGERGWLFPVAFKIIPGMRLFRFPERFLLWTELATAVLGAMGAEVILSRLRGRTRPIIVAILVAVTLAALFAAESKQNVCYPARDWLFPPATVPAVRADQAAGLQPRASSVTATAEIVYYTWLFSDGGWEGHLQDLFEDRTLLAPSSNAIWGVPLLTGYTELVPKWSAKLWRGQHTLSLLGDWDERMIRRSEVERSMARPWPGYLELLGAANARFVISRWPLADKRLREIPMPFNYYQYRNPEALGRAYLVPGAQDIGSDSDFLALARSGRADYRHEVYLDGRGSQAQSSFGAIPVRARDDSALTRVTLEPQAPAPCWLVLSDAYYPGWSVSVNGEPAKLERANLAMRAVRLPAGRHHVEFRYRCRPLEIGWVVAAVSGLLWLLAMLLLPRRFPQTEGEPAAKEPPPPGRRGQPDAKRAEPSPGPTRRRRR